VILWGGPEGFSVDRMQKLPIENALTVRAADLNRNGYPDLVFGTRVSSHRNLNHEGSVVIFWGGPDGYAFSRCCELPSYQTNNITMADLNNNGYIDIFASSYFNSRERDVNSFIYWNDHGHFSVTNRQRLFAHSSSGSLACDLNEDGYVDLVVSHHRAYGSHRTESAIWWNGPDGFDEKHRTFLPTLGPHDMAGVDVGNILTRGPEEYYDSPVEELPQGSGLSRLTWEADIPHKTWVRAQVRVADTREALAQEPFTGPDGSDATWYACGQAVGRSRRQQRYAQYRLALGAVNSISTPRITAVTLHLGADCA
jgi:hypothetical protein